MGRYLREGAPIWMAQHFREKAKYKFGSRKAHPNLKRFMFFIFWTEFVLTFSVRHPAASGVPRQGFQYPHCRPLGPGGTGHPSTSYTGSRTGLVCDRKKLRMLGLFYCFIIIYEVVLLKKIVTVFEHKYSVIMWCHTSFARHGCFIFQSSLWYSKLKVVLKLSFRLKQKHSWKFMLN